MVTLNLTPPAGGDDGFSIMDLLVFHSTEAYLVFGQTWAADNESANAFLRFTGGPPQGAVITAAWLEFVAETSWETDFDPTPTANPIKTRIFGVDEDASAAPTTYATWLTDHGLHTTAFVDWDFNNQDSGALQSPDITPIIQEIVDRAGYSGVIQLHIDDDGSVPTSGETAAQGVESFEGSPDPILHIEYADASDPLLGPGRVLEDDTSKRLLEDDTSLRLLEANVQFDAYSQPAGPEFTTTDPLTWTHTPVGVPRGVYVPVICNSAADAVDGLVTYGGVPLTRIASEVRSVSEAGFIAIYFLGAGIPTGAQTVSIAHTASAVVKVAGCITVTATCDLDIVTFGTVTSGSIQTPHVDITSIEYGLRVVAGFTGHGAVSAHSPDAGFVSALEHLFTGAATTALIYYQTPHTQGLLSTGYTSTGNDDSVMVAAVIERALFTGYSGVLDATQADDVADLAGSHTVPAYQGVLAGIQADNVADLAGSHSVPEFEGVLAGVQEEQTADWAGSHSMPEYEGVLAAVQADQVADLAGSHSVPEFEGVLTAVQADQIADLTGAYSAPEFEGVLNATQADDVADLAGSHSIPEYEGVLVATQSDDVADLAGSHSVPEFEGVLVATQEDQTADLAGSYSIPEYEGVLTAVQADQVADFTGSHSVPVYSGSFGASPILSTAVLLLRANRYSGSGNWIDEASGHDAVISGSPSFDGEKFTLDGATDYFTVADHADLNFGSGDSFTVMVCFAPVDDLAGGSLIDKRNGAGAGYDILGGATWIHRINGTSGVPDDRYTSNASFNGVKKTTALRRDVGLDQVEAFLNGVGTGSPSADSTNGSLNTTDPLRIGVRGAGASLFLAADIYAVAIWRVALSSADLLAAHNEMMNPPGLLQEDQVADLAGSHTVPAYQGVLAGVQADNVADLAGSFGTPGYTGTLGATQEDDVANLTGDFTAQFVGVLDATQADDIAALAGSFTVPSYTGTLGATQADDVADFTGDFTELLIYVGTLGATQGDDVGSWIGTHVPPTLAGVLNAVQEDQIGNFSGNYPVDVLLPTSRIYWGEHRVGAIYKGSTLVWTG